MSKRSHRKRRIWEILESDDEKLEDGARQRNFSASPVPELEAADAVIQRLDSLASHFPRGKGLLRAVSKTPAPTVVIDLTSPQLSSPHDARPPLLDLQQSPNSSVANVDHKPTQVEAKAPTTASTKSPVKSTDASRTTRNGHKSIEPGALFHNGQQVLPWSAHDIHSDTGQQYLRVLNNVEQIIERYSSRDEDPFIADDSEPVQWPVPRRKGRAIVLICSCKSRKKSCHTSKMEMARCRDPACDVPGGWHHLQCLSKEELKNMATAPHWICNACIHRREHDGYPELRSESLAQDRREQFMRKVVAWSLQQPHHKTDDEGFSATEAGQAVRIDARLRERRMWFFPEDHSKWRKA